MMEFAPQNIGGAVTQAKLDNIQKMLLISLHLQIRHAQFFLQSAQVSDADRQKEIALIAGIEEKLRALGLPAEGDEGS